MDIEGSDHLLRRLMAWATQPEYVYRHEWQLGDAVMWDNTGTMHRVLPYLLNAGAGCTGRPLLARNRSLFASHGQEQPSMGETEPPSTLPAVLSRVVAARGTHAAIMMAHETVSYDELDRRTARMARALLSAGAGKGARIGLLAPDGILWVTRVPGGSAHRRARHADQHALHAAGAGPHPAQQRLPVPDRRAPVPEPRLRRHTGCRAAGTERRRGRGLRLPRRALSAVDLAGRCRRARLGAVDR